MLVLGLVISPAQALRGRKHILISRTHSLYRMCSTACNIARAGACGGRAYQQRGGGVIQSKPMNEVDAERDCVMTA